MEPKQPIERIVSENGKVIIYEDVAKAVDKEIRKRRNKWRYTHLEFEDVAQSLRLHIWKKFSRWDQSRNFIPWVNRVITHALINIIRDSYANLTKPCVKCAGNEGDVFCRFTPSHTQCSECPMYKNWAKKKKPAFDIKLPVSIENHTDEVSNMSGKFFDIESAKLVLEIELKKILTVTQYKVFKMIYVENRSDAYVAEKMNFRTTEIGRMPGYRQIKNYKDLILEASRKIIKEKDIV